LRWKDRTQLKTPSQSINKLNPQAAAKDGEPSVPADLRQVLGAAPTAKAQWMDLTTLARRDFISWIDSAKQPETRKRRVESLPSRLAAGRRRPCCFSVVPFDLHKALASAPKAKAHWSDLDSTARRDFIDWITSAKEPEARKRRIRETCMALAAGKHYTFLQSLR
jgi:uncharacterized protein YdeI (YjbR/CyaY-like superfamily)